MEQEFIKLSVQINKQKEELMKKEEIVQKLSTDKTKVQELLLQKCTELEELNIKYQKIFQDLKMRQQKSMMELDEEIQNKNRTILDEKSKYEKKLTEQKEYYEGKIKSKDERISQLMLERESKNDDILKANDLTILKLNSELENVKEKLLKMKDSFEVEKSDLSHKKKEEIQAIKKENDQLSSKVKVMDEEMKRLERRLKHEHEEDLINKDRIMKDAIEKQTLYLDERRNAENREKLAFEKIAALEKITRDLLSANEQLTVKLKDNNNSKGLSSRRSHNNNNNNNSLPKVSSNNKPGIPLSRNDSESSLTQNSYRLIGSSSQSNYHAESRKVESNLISSFDGQLHKENVAPMCDVNNVHQVPNLPKTRKFKKEDYENNINNDRNIHADKNQTLIYKPMIRITPSKDNSGVLKTNNELLNTFQQFKEVRIDNSAGSKAHEDQKIYSSRYSKRSPTPSKSIDHG